MIEYDTAQLKALRAFEPTDTIEEWAAVASNKNIPWTCEMEWNGPRAGKAIHPSSLGNSCDMVLFLELIGGGSVRKNSPHDQMIFDVGTAVHEMFQYYQGTRALTHGYDYWPEVGFDYRKKSEAKELCMAGHADGLSVGWPIPEASLLWEYKTIGDSPYERLKKPSKTYMAQIHAYMINIGAPAAIIMYINKNNSNLAAFKVPFDWDFWNPIQERILRIVEAVKQIKEPVRNVSSACYRCRFFEDCDPPVGPKRHRHGAPEL